jgi:hypothetical protein
MTEAQYERIIKAAMSLKRSKFALAEALVLDIPEDTDHGLVGVALEEVAAQIVDTGADELSITALRSMRNTALWVYSKSDQSEFGWVEGSPYTAHMRAAEGGMDYDLFARKSMTTREVQAALGNKVSSNTVNHTVENMTTVEKVDMARALAADDINTMTDVVVQGQRDAVIKAAERVKDAPAPTFKDPSTSTMNTKRLDELKDVMSRNVAFTKLVVQRWQREVKDLGGFVKASDNRVMAGYLDGAVQEYVTFIDELEASV